MPRRPTKPLRADRDERRIRRRRPDPEWGFAGSPLVVDDVVIVAVGGRLAAYDLASGEPRWLALAGG